VRTGSATAPKEPTKPAGPAPRVLCYPQELIASVLLTCSAPSATSAGGRALHQQIRGVPALIRIRRGRTKPNMGGYSKLRRSTSGAQELPQLKLLPGRRI